MPPPAGPAGTPGPTPILPPRGSQPLRGSRPLTTGGAAGGTNAADGTAAPDGAGSGRVTRLLARQPAKAWNAPDDVPRPRRQVKMGWFLGGAGVLVAIGLVVVIVLAALGTFGGDRALHAGTNPKQTGPPLAQACPPPTATGDPGYHEGPPPPPGPRTTDTKAGISYKSYPSPWQPWTQDWVAGQLGVHYTTGQGFVTEVYSKGPYWASILSGTVPATVNDGTTLDLKCVGQQIVADVRGSGSNRGYYPQPNTMDKIEDKLTTVGGVHAWVSVFRLHYHEQGLQSDNELVGVVTLDVGKKTAAVLYISIPGTHKQYDWVVDDVINSIRPA